MKAGGAGDWLPYPCCPGVLFLLAHLPPNLRSWERLRKGLDKSRTAEVLEGTGGVPQ